MGLLMPRAEVGDLAIVYDVQGTGPPVLMINGIGAARNGWGLQVPVFEQGFEVITFDNRDVGETGPGTNSASYSMQQFADDAAGLLDAVGIEAVHIVGASMGGAIAQEFAIAYPDRTRSVTIVCSWPKTDPWMDELMSQWDEVFRDPGDVWPGIGQHGSGFSRIAFMRTPRIWRCS